MHVCGRREGVGVCMCVEGEWCVHVCGYVCMCEGGEWCVHVCVHVCAHEADCYRNVGYTNYITDPMLL